MSAESIEFRRATPQDVSAMTLVLMRANAQRDGEPLPVMAGDSQAAHMYERISNPNRWAYVAADGERVVGASIP